MIRNGKFRFTLQFGMRTIEEQTVGKLLEQLGKRKSPLVVAALYEYYQRHPELKKGDACIQFRLSAPDTHHLEDTIRQLIEERLSKGDVVIAQTATNSEDTCNQINEDILDMLSDLDCFE